MTAIRPASGRRRRALRRPRAAPGASPSAASRKLAIFAAARGNFADRELRLLALGPTTELGRFGLAAACIGAATLLRLALGLVAADVLPFGLYLPAIVVAALLGGWRAGLAATAMAGGLAWWLFILPRADFAARRQELVVNLALMLAVSAVVVAIAARLREVLARLRRESEALTERTVRYDAIFGSMSEGFALCDAIRGPGRRLIDYEVVEINPALRRMLGVGPEAAGSKLSDSAGDWGQWLALCERVLESGEPERFEYENLATRLWHEVHVSRVSEGRMAQFFFDITERKAAERRQAALFEELNHRVKNNLALVSSLLQLQGRGEDPIIKAKLDKAIGRIGGIAQVHDALSNIGRDGKIDFAPYLKHLCAGLERSLLSDDRVKLQVEAQSADVSADKAVALGMVVNELVTNALKYAYPPPTAGMIHVRLRQAGKELLLSVSDGGKGLPEAMPTDGRSLGMKIVASLIGQVKGRMTIVRENGATFDIIVPSG